MTRLLPPLLRSILLLGLLLGTPPGLAGPPQEDASFRVFRDGAWSTAEEEWAAALQDTLISLRVTSGNNIGLTIYNNGFLGTNLSDRSPSLEYPLRSGQDHLVRAGLWVGALTPAEDSLVSTATIDGYFGSFDPNGVSEFYPAATLIEERSILPNSRYFHPDAKSEQDFRLSFIDRHIHAGPEHVPLDLRVELETLLFSFEPFDAIVIANYRIINDSPDDFLFDVYVGLYSELATGWKDDHTEWPPSAWFGNKDIAYVDSLRLHTEHHYNNDGGDAPSWGGLVLLGTGPIAVDDLEVSFNWWNWDPNFTLAGTPRDDAERYATMSNRSIDPTSGTEAPNNDPVGLLSVGPFPTLEPADTILVSFALLGGAPSAKENRTAEEDIAFNSGWAQTAFDLNFNIPVPPPSPTLEVVPGIGSLALHWTDDPEEFLDPKSREFDFEGYRIYVSEDREETGFRMVRQIDLVDSLLENTGLDALRDPTMIEGVDYEYRYDIGGLKDGFDYWVAVTSFDTGTIEVAPLESGLSQNRTFAIPGGPATDVGSVKVFPNPYRGDAAWDGTLARDRYLWFVNLPSRCTIRIYTLAGDLVDTIEFDGETYNATEIRGIFDPTDVRNPESDIPTLSGGMAAWDLVSRNDQGIASGLYLFSVEDHETGDTQLGKFLVLK
ncbi:MAG: hypothetical protein GF346_09980 [Candidatus Eisenbacteria bacterium]|nr:hypothetical protein [Candidatus Latescibacterota bacterium]MBD3302763.1 hypothetical protein [Candidatus Eisenbacteria bacterium]